MGKTIADVRVALRKIAVAPDGTHFERELRGERIVGVTRRGKYAVLALESGAAVVISLRMTGRLTVVERGRRTRHPHTHVTIRFTDGSRLEFADTRQFGRIRLIAAQEPWAAALGVEPLGLSFTPERFIGMLSGRRAPVKAFLLDQRRIAGIGNIYACEALWQAGIRPGKASGTLSKPAIRRLYRALVRVLERAIALRGSSIDDYVDARGRKGGAQDALCVYGKDGRPCPRCGKAIVRTVIAQRGTWWCRACQK